LMREAARPLRRAMRIKASVEVTAPLHNAMACLLFAIAAANDEEARGKPARPGPRRRD